MPPPPPHLMDELVEECFLRLPPDDSLVRAALVCKRWHRILGDRGFRRRYYNFHHGTTSPMLGFFHVNNRTGGGACFTPTSSFRPRNADDHRLRGQRAIDSRHGRVLLASRPSLNNLTVWDPITGEQVDLPRLPPPRHQYQFGVFNSRAAVHCAGGACDHVDCHRGHFVVVLMHTYHHKVYAHVYSSRAGAWRQTTSTHHQEDLGAPPIHIIFHLDPCASAGNALYFSVSMNMRTGIVKYDLGAQEISFISLPPNCAGRRCQIALTTREDGGLGIARVDNSRLHLWSMDGVSGWAPSGVVDLDTLLPVLANNVGCIYMVSFVHGRGAFFVRVNAGIFIVDLVSGRVRKLADNKSARCFVPYTSFCIPAFKEGRNQVHGV